MNAQKEQSTVEVLLTLPMEEQATTATRKEVVKNSLANLGIQCCPDKIPNIAVLGSGGGLRAMIALYGTLTELKKSNLLDCVMYLCGVSGSTWCMSSLYKNEDWSEEIETLEEHKHKKLVEDELSLTKAAEAVLEALKDEHFSLTDFWAYFIVYDLLKELDESKLSEQRRSCENGKNPYPIYAAVDKHRYSRHEAGSWFEFTPHNAGVFGIDGNLSKGAYVDMKEFGSVFKEGQLKKNKEEKTICYLQGLCGSALGSEREIKNAIIGKIRDIIEYCKKKYFHCYSNDAVSNSQDHQNHKILIQAYEYVLELQLCVSDVPALKAEKYLNNLDVILKFNQTSKSYQLVHEMHQNWSSSDADTRENACLKLWEALNEDFGEPAEDLMTSNLCQGIQVFAFFNWMKYIYKIISCLRKWMWGTTCNFLYNMSDIEDPGLKGKEVVSLVDAGVAINSAYPLVLHPERKVKLILSFDYSAGDPFETVKKAAEYCKVRGIKFPVIDESKLQDKDNPSNCYIFRGDDLTVMHFPLFNKGNCQDKIDEYRNTFSTFKLSYTKEEIQKLLTAAKKNVGDVQQQIQEEIKSIVGSSSKKA